MAAYSFWRDEKAHLEISKCGNYDCLGQKVESNLYYSCPRYRATITFDFGIAIQEDGHAPHDGDSTREFAECVSNLIRSSMPNNAEFVAKYKALLSKLKSKSNLVEKAKNSELIDDLYLL